MDPLRYLTRKEFPITFPHFKHATLLRDEHLNAEYETFLKLISLGYKPLGRMG